MVTGLGFGIPGVLGLRHFARTGEVWTFAGFPTYGGGPFENLGLDTSSPLLAGFVVVCVAEVGLAVALWRGGPRSATFSHGLLPMELAYWSGFALPFGFVFGIARTLLLLARPRSSAWGEGGSGDGALGTPGPRGRTRGRGGTT